MKCLSHAVLSAGLLALTLASSSNAQVPQHLNHQGILTDDAGVIVPDGTYVLQFQIYDTPSASTTPLFEQQLTANVVNGLYNVLLSDNQGGALGDAFTGATRYLQLKIITSPGGTYDNLVLSPRQQAESRTRRSYPRQAASRAETRTPRRLPTGTPHLPGLMRRSRALSPCPVTVT